jgi:hypothetical protein
MHGQRCVSGAVLVRRRCKTIHAPSQATPPRHFDGSLVGVIRATCPISASHLTSTWIRHRGQSVHHLDEVDRWKTERSVAAIASKPADLSKRWSQLRVVWCLKRQQGTQVNAFQVRTPGLSESLVTCPFSLYLLCRLMLVLLHTVHVHVCT